MFMAVIIAGSGITLFWLLKPPANPGDAAMEPAPAADLELMKASATVLSHK